MDNDFINKIIDGDTNEPSYAVETSKSLNDEYLEDFLVETKEHIESIEMNALALENNKNDTAIIDEIFRDFHTIKGLAGFVSQSLVQKIAHQTETILDKCRKGESTIQNSTIQLILKSSDYIKCICEDLKISNNPDFTQEISCFLDQIESEYKHADSDDLFTLDSLEKKKVSDADQLGDNNDRLDDLIDDIIESQNSEKTFSVTYKKQAKKEESLLVRIPIKKIDTLVDLASELVIYHSQFEEKAISHLKVDESLNANFRRISTITKQIQDLSMSLRMVSLKQVFQRTERLGRDTVKSLKKNVEITLLGEDTEIDRGVVEKIVDPLIHLINNSIYHGIEDKKERIKKGKDPIGRVKIEAYSKKGIVFIEVSDDGRGIDTKKVLQKAMEKNLIDPFIDYSDDDILNFIFLPGFSVVESADNISGRGVGLDVVKTQVQKIGGKVEVVNEFGKGCSFIMKMPINMAIMNGTIVDIGGSRFIIPTFSICKIFNPLEEDWISIKGNKTMVKLGEKIIPLIDIQKILDLKEFNKFECLIVALESSKKMMALPINQIIEKRDVVVKSLGSNFDNLSYVFGASILGNGNIAIILDVENMFKKEVD